MTIQIGISACVLGEKVRYDGGHKNSPFCSAVLSSFVRYLPICPEQAIGMGIPRPAIRLLKTADGDIRLVNSKDSSIDFTEKMHQFTDAKLPALAQLSGYIVCAKSPSCGMERVRIVDEQGALLGKVATGLFTQRLMQKYPWLPVEEDGRLLDADLKENFITRVYALHAWQQMLATGFSIGKLVEFHSQFKFLIMAHHPTAYRELGRLVAQAKLFALDDLAQRYLLEFMRALKQLATRKQHANVLMHLQGFFKKMLSPAAKQELLSLIHQYRLGHAPLMAPLTLLKHHLSLHPHQYVAAQRYLLPYPPELGLRA
ncbi:MAG: DUF523 and DUF1722 domain-containing protein [Gammaproteobacteria bacterium]|jgi:uncharacterized protein YbgA (DUF1722 family)/uncharacterized protein YbbK (DUF523 family)|nr:DUF523 and DUF1722 domain-containing protein [Gammaproteobacteria bacterium]MBU2427603.1 DUF523 and DUF1722 domain-containing protein [Gammaproteobacteria bacterium]